MADKITRLQHTVDNEAMLWGNDVAENYHGVASEHMDAQWRDYIKPFLDAYPINLNRTLDFAAGFGRNTRKLFEAGADHVTMVDVNADCIDVLRSKFEGSRGTVIHNSGFDLSGVDDASITFVYSFDAMVHFDLEVIAAYLPEFARVLSPSGYALLHHSNFDTNPGGDFRSNPHWRNFMSAAVFKHLAVRAKLEVIEQRPVDWGSQPLDCITILRKS